MTRIDAIRERSSLVAQAKAVPGKVKRPYIVDDEAIELAVAYLSGEVSDAQVAAVRECSPSNARFWVVAILRRAVAAGKAKVEVVT